MPRKPPARTLREIDPEAFIASFSECWAKRFAQHDGSYFHSQAAIGSEVRQAIHALLERSSTAVAS